MGALFSGLTNTAQQSTPTASYAPTNGYVKNYPGVDPYYGITIYDLPGASLASEDSDTNNTALKYGSIATNPTTKLPFYTGYTTSKNGVQKPTLDSLKEEAKWYNENYPGYLPSIVQMSDTSQNAGVMSPYFPDMSSYYGPKTTSANADTGSGGGGSSTGFKIARPNMTWVNGMPSVMPQGGGIFGAMYPSPYTAEANTPPIEALIRGLTYNNPYNTNPYLPLSNPFALTPASGGES